MADRTAMMTRATVAVASAVDAVAVVAAVTKMVATMAMTIDIDGVTNGGAAVAAYLRPKASGRPVLVA